MPTQVDILKAIAEHLGLAPEDLDRQTSLRDELGLGPIELNDLLTDLSNQFNVVFEREDIESMKTVQDLVEMVEDNLLD